MNERERRQSAEIQRDIANDVAIGESVKRDVAEQVAANTAYERDLMEQRAFEAQMEADDARRMTRNVTASSAMAYGAAESAQHSSFITGVIALFVIVGLLLGGVVLYNNYKEKNDQLYSSNINNDRNRTENRLLRQSADRESQRADAATQAATVAASQPAPPVQVRVTVPTPIPAPPANVNVIVPPATHDIGHPAPDLANPVPEITPSPSDNAENNSDSNSITVTTEPKP